MMWEIVRIMEKSSYNMKLYGKYWGLLLVGIFILWVWRKRESRELLWYSILACLVVFCPVSFALLSKISPALEVYYPITWILPIPMVVGYCVTVFYRDYRPSDWKKTLAVTAGLVLFLFTCGMFYFLHGNTVSQNKYRTEADYVAAYEYMSFGIEGVNAKGNAKGNATEGVTFAGPNDFMWDARTYSANLYPVYGRDLEQPDLLPGYQETYSAAVQNLHDLYQTYETTGLELSQTPEGAAQLADLLGQIAIAAQETGCEYLAFTVKENAAANDQNREAILKDNGFVRVWQEGSLELYQRVD